MQQQFAAKNFLLDFTNFSNALYKLIFFSINCVFKQSEKSTNVRHFSCARFELNFDCMKSELSIECDKSTKNSIKYLQHREIQVDFF